MKVFHCLFFLALTASPTAGISQKANSKINEYWVLSDIRIRKQSMSEFSRALYYNLVMQYYPKKSLLFIQEKSENIRFDYKLQDFIFLKFLILFGKGEKLRFHLADMCGSYAIGNVTAKYIEAKYSKDKRYLQRPETVPTAPSQQDEPIIEQDKPQLDTLSLKL